MSLTKLFWEDVKALVPTITPESLFKYYPLARSITSTVLDPKGVLLPQLYPSSATCGVTEIGGIFGSGTRSRPHILGSLLNAMMDRRGLVLYYCPSGDPALEALLKRYGFEQTKDFINPNTNHQVFEWSIKLGYLKEYL
jgi:hypothetical protein